MTAEHTLGLAPAAEARFEEYLTQMRRALLGVPDVSPAEIEADIREHVENELRGAARPVEPVVLETVLRRLGPPTQWLPPGRVPVAAQVSAGFSTLGQYVRARVRAAREAVWRGPEDWRLAYLSFGVFAVGILSVPFFPLFLVISYFLSRAGIAAAADKGIALDAGRKWLLYPPVVLVSLALVLGVVGAPVGFICAIVDETGEVDRYERWELAGRPTVGGVKYATPLRGRALIDHAPHVETRLDRVLAAFPGFGPTRVVLAVGFLSAGVLLAWWAAVGCLAAALPGLARGLVFPFAQRFPGPRASWVGTACLLLLVAWAAVAYRVAEAAGLV